jgi:ribonucleotide reductase beta subunit family protein with ferritin-like domain
VNLQRDVELWKNPNGLSEDERRVVQVGLNPPCSSEENLFPWMSKMIDLKKEHKFFATRLTE